MKHPPGDKERGEDAYMKNGKNTMTERGDTEGPRKGDWGEKGNRIKSI